MSKLAPPPRRCISFTRKGLARRSATLVASEPSKHTNPFANLSPTTPKLICNAT